MSKEILGLIILVGGAGTVGGAGATAWALHALSLGTVVVMVFGGVAAFIGGRMMGW